MTISITGPRFSYAGNGSTTVFSFPRQFFLSTDLDVYLVDNVSGVPTLQTLGTHYSVTGAGSGSGGNVTMVTAPPTGQTLVIVRDTPITQGLDLDSVTALPMTSLEAALDRAMMTIDELNTKAVKGPMNTVSAFDYMMPTPVAGKFLRTKSDVTGLEWASAQEWISGSGVPASTLGNVDDFYFNTATGAVYQKTNSTTWTFQANLSGPMGQSGSATAAKELDTVASLLVDTTLTYTAGSNSSVVAGDYVKVRSGAHVYQVQASGSSTNHIVTSGGVKLNVLPGPNGFSVKAFGATGDGSTNDVTALQLAIDKSTSRVYIPSGEYKISTALVLPSNMELTGEGYGSKITSTGTDKRVAYADSKSFITIRNLFINGNLTGNGSTATGVTGGDGIAFIGCSNILVDGCLFDNIGKALYTGFASSLNLNTCSKVRINNNVFLSSNICGSGADIGMGYYCSQFIVTGNLSVSEADAFIACASVGATDLDTAHHVISNNMGFRIDGSSARSGIIATYNPKTTFSTVSNNVLVNFQWSGIYVQSANEAVQSENTGGVAITGNIIRYCSGGSSSLGAGIYLAGEGGITCNGNVIYKAGYNSSGAARANAADGIWVYQTTRNVNVTGNTIKLCSGRGVAITSISGTVQMENIAANSNIVYDCLVSGIWVQAQNTGTAMKDVLISNNLVKQFTNDADGITVNINSGTPTISQLTVIGNHLTGVSSSTKSGITTNYGNPNAWLFKDNVMTSWANGFKCTTFPGDQIFGTACILDGNTIKDCTNGFSIGSTGVTQNGYAFNTIYINVTNRHASANYYDAVNIGVGNVQIRKAAVPTGGTWRVGDRIVPIAPAVGSPKAWTCTTAGSPGAWTSEGNL